LRTSYSFIDDTNLLGLLQITSLFCRPNTTLLPPFWSGSQLN